MTNKELKAMFKLYSMTPEEQKVWVSARAEEEVEIQDYRPIGKKISDAVQFATISVALFGLGSFALWLVLFITGTFLAAN